jgi:hypothetical protein
VGLFAWSYDIDSLRALAYARLRVSAGEGLESVVTHLEASDLGLVARSLGYPVHQMRAGQDARASLQEQIAGHHSRSYRELLTCLLAEGPAALARMDELSEEIQVDRKVRVEQFGKGLEFRLKILAVLFVISFAQVFMEIFASVPENAIVPTIELPPAFLFVFYLLLSVGVIIVVATCRFHE